MVGNNIASLRNVTILYAEDEDALRDVTSSILRSFTKHQYIAVDGKQGLELFIEHQDEIDIIITDINMPYMNGLDMAKAIKEINPNIPIIVATAFSNTEYLLEAINLGIDKYVLKPVDMKKLLQAMGQSLMYHELKDLYIDNLTHLPNRNKLKKDLLSSSCDLLALFNIDKFSTINDLYGESNGDLILQQFALRLQEFFGLEDFTVYRVEADKFVVYSKNYNKDIYEFESMCKRFAVDIESNDIVLEDNEIDINVTIGLAKDENAKAYAHAQRVVNYARKKYEQIMIYNEALNIRESFVKNIKWVKKIKSGLLNNRFKAHFQPIYNVSTGSIVKYESLVRYIDDDGSISSPAEFLSIAKKAKLYPSIIKVMLGEAIELIKQKNKKVAVNISFDDIASKTTVDYIISKLSKNKVFTHNLEFEILESEQIQNFNIVKDFIKLVKEYGCKVGVDDFGAGYSNFNMLANLDIDFVKIDGSLIDKINVDAHQQIIVETIVSFTKRFNFTTIAEYVSNKEIFEIIKSIGVDYAQGYYFRMPISFDEV